MSYDKVPLLLPMNGANNGIVFPDYSPVQKAITVFGNAKTVTAESKYYGSSAYFDGSGDYLQTPGASAFDFAGEDFTIEAWIRPTNFSTSRWIIGNGSSTNAYVDFYVFTDGALYFNAFLTSGVVTLASAASAVPVAAWSHVAGVRNGSNFFAFVNGTQVATETSALNMANRTPTWNIGGQTTTFPFLGYMQDIRITKGLARYTTAFTPPTRLTGIIGNAGVGAGKILNAAGVAAARTVFAVPRIAPVRTFSTVSNASGEFEIQAPVGVDHSVVALADETDLYNDLVARVIPV